MPCHSYVKRGLPLWAGKGIIDDQAITGCQKPSYRGVEAIDQPVIPVFNAPNRGTLDHGCKVRLRQRIKNAVDAEVQKNHGEKLLQCLCQRCFA